MSTVPKGSRHDQKHPVPPLQPGDHLSRAEFERRYVAMPHVKKAELIEGEVYMPSPVSEDHAEPHALLTTWATVYAGATPGAKFATELTVRLDGANEVQPDVQLRVKPEIGGQSRTSPEGYVEGAPELVAEVAATTASIDLHKKLRAYERNGVREYIVVRSRDEAVDWFVLRDNEFRPLEPGPDGLLRSEVFPGLWLDPNALLRADVARVLAVLQDGIGSTEHAAFVAELAGRSVGCDM